MPGEEVGLSDAFTDDSEPGETVEESVLGGTENKAVEEYAIPEGETLEEEYIPEDTVIEESETEPVYAGEDSSVGESFESKLSESVENVTEESVATVASVGTTSEETTEDNKIVVGDGVTATFDADTGAVEFTSQNGELWRDWVNRLGVSISEIKTIKVSSGTVYLPADSSGYYYDEYNNKNMYYLFGGLSNLNSLDLSSFDTSNVTDMQSMFRGCNSLTNLDLSSFDTSNVTDMSNMFYGCRSLTNLDLSS
ncbi:MAG: DUF285 domain-containing protein, partial [Lachnospiraceae bacterium]|nr:DUF285 domain-containing protein [Lachnospiraceae bacterium]